MASPKDNTDLEEVKSFIRSIVTANPLVSTIQSIQKEYIDFIGSSIPYHQLGYNSVEHFFKNIPDTCKVQGTGPFAQVTPIVSEKSAHINEMVMKQKVTAKKKRFPSRRPNPGRYTVPNMRRSINWQSTYNFAISPNSSFTSSSSCGYSSSGFPKTANKITANFRPAVVATSIQNKNTAVKNTNPQNTGRGRGVVKGQNFINGLRTENTEEKRNFILEQNKQGTLKIKQRLAGLIQEQERCGNVTKALTSPPKNEKTEILNNSKTSYLPEYSPGWQADNSLNLRSDNKESRQEYSKKAIDNSEDGYFERSQERLHNLLYNFNIVEEEEEDISNVPKRVQCNLRTLISQFNDGIWCSDLPGHYKRLFSKELMYMEYGYTSLIEMCIALKNIFHYVRPGRDDFKLYDRSKPLPENVEKHYTMASYDIREKVTSKEALPDLDWADFRGHIPDDVFKYGNEIPRDFLPIGTKVENILDVVVVEIYDLSKFWIYLGNSDNSTALDELMDRMQTFYNQSENAKEYAIPPGAIREGLYCVQVIYGEWHRARIVRILPEHPDYVRVMYIDYGTVCKASIKGLCFLHVNFAELNAQAIRCRLANIVPNLKGQPWPRTASDRFRELVNRRDTLIKVSYIDWNEEYVCVFLADVTDSASTVYINETLVKEGHAVWAGETQVVPFVLSNYKCKVQNIHLFPTFGELEYGLAPNAGEMYTLEDMLMPLQFSLGQYFEPDEEIIPDDDYDSKIEQMEDMIIESVKNHRKFTPVCKVDIDTIINPPPINFDIFGDLKEDMIEFYGSISAEGDSTQHTDRMREEELFCDIEEAATGKTLKHCKIERNLEEFEPIRLIKQDKELSESIIKKLEMYRKLGSDYLSDSEPKMLDLNLREDLMTPPEVKEISELSTIFEQSEMEMDISDSLESPNNPFVGLGFNNAHSSSRSNIFDNPEECDRASDASENDNEQLISPESFLAKTSDDVLEESKRPISPESFLRVVEKISRKDLEEESDAMEESYSTTESSSVVRPDSEKSFYSKSFLKSQKRAADVASASSCEPSASVSGQSPRESNCEASFLKTCDSNERFEQEEEEKTKVGQTVCNGLTTGGAIYKAHQGNIDLPSRSNVEDTRKSFLSSLSLNNPFRPYLETSDLPSGSHADYVSTIGSEDKNITEDTTLADAASTDSFARTLLEIKIKHKDAEAQTSSSKTSDSDASDYKTFVPRSFQPKPSIVPNQENGNPWVQSFTLPRGMDGPQRVQTPPRLFTPPPNFVPGGYPPYPQWSNGSGYPVPQYPQWSTGCNYPPYPNYSQPRDIVRPPPGFSYQGPPQNFNPYMTPRMIHVPPAYPPSGPMYPPQRHMLVPTTERDFYERYNETILKNTRGPF